MSSPGNFPLPYPTRRLPSHPSLEQLRKQAKELLEEYRTGDPTAVAEVRQFERQPPPEFALSDAQRVLARAYGYESWTKLKDFVDGVNVSRLAEAVKAGDVVQAAALIRARPELVGMDMAGDNEHRALHYAVLRRDVAMVRMLMQAGSDARKGIFPHREATSAYALAKDREYQDVVTVIEEEEQRRRQSSSSPNSAASPVQDQINEAIRSGDNNAAIRMLQQDEGLIRACDHEGGTPLHVAAAAANAEMVEWLLGRRANVSKLDGDGLTPLDRAAMAANPHNEDAKIFPSIARLLLDHGAEMTVRAAVALADGPRIREMVAANPGVLREIHWMRGGLLSLAVNHDRIESVRLLLDLGADVDERTMLHELEEPTTSWGTPLWNATLARQREIVELLLDRGADPNANVYASGWPLRNAYGDEALRRLLLDRGARLQPYMVAEADDAATAAQLLESDSSEELARELTWAAACHGSPSVIQLSLPRLNWPPKDPRWNWILIQPIRGIDPGGEDHEGFFECMATLLARGIDPNVSSRFGQTTLHFLAARGGLTGPERSRFAAMLLDHGARLDVRDELLQSTPLGWACRWGRKELVEFLIERGAQVDEADAEAWATPPAWAGKKGHAEIAEILRHRGS